MKTNIFRPKNLFMIFLGNTTMALGIVMFVLPNELMTGGTTGLSLIIDHYLHLPISVFVFIFNCIMFLLGALILGFDFALTTLISTFYYPIAFDFLILIGQALFCDKEAILYGILLVMTYTIVLDKILVIGQAQTQVKIISQKSDEINEAITRKMDRGSTLLHTETGYLHSRQNMILTVISNRELSKLNQLVMEIDPTAFMIIGKVNEVHGNGFTLPKKHAVKTEK